MGHLRTRAYDECNDDADDDTKNGNFTSILTESQGELSSRSTASDHCKDQIADQTHGMYDACRLVTNFVLVHNNSGSDWPNNGNIVTHSPLSRPFFIVFFVKKHSEAH